MIPFNAFRRRIQSPTAQIYYSDLLDGVDYWGKKDRERLIEGARLYAKYYALDWALTTAVIVLVTHFLLLLVYTMLGRQYPIDYMDTLFTIVLSALLTGLGARHIIDCYQKALDLKIGGEYDGL